VKPVSAQGNFDASDEKDALERAYVPEHIPVLMSLISKGRPFRLGEYLGYTHDNWLILVGYPLDGQFTPAECEQAVAQALESYRPEYLWFIGPEFPATLQKGCQGQSQDVYYRLDLENYQLKSSLCRQVNKAAELLSVEREMRFGKEHQALVTEFLHRRQLSPTVAELYRLIPAYLEQSSSACLLTARDRRGRLSAFFVIEQAARNFDAYVLGCYSLKFYVPYASDLLFKSMIDLANEQHKPTINLGLGVNKGISRFKQKWGGVPFLNYATCECYYGPPRMVSILDQWMDSGR